MPSTVEQEIEVPLSVPDAYQKFFELVWVAGVGLPMSFMVSIKVTNEGDENKVGHTRYISPAGVTEKIVATEAPTKLQYSVIKGPFPAKDHLGTVTFEEVSESVTKVVWTATFKPRLPGAMVRGLVSSVFSSGLKAYKKQILAEQKEAANSEKKEEQEHKEVAETV